MGVGKTERLGTNESRFKRGRRVDEANDRIIRNLKIKGGTIRKNGDKWLIVVNQLNPGNTGSGGSGNAGTNGRDGRDGEDGGSSRCADCCNYKEGCPDSSTDPTECAHEGPPDGSYYPTPGMEIIPSGWGEEPIEVFPGGAAEGDTDSHEDGEFPGKTGPCW